MKYIEYEKFETITCNLKKSSLDINFVRLVLLYVQFAIVELVLVQQPVVCAGD